MKIRNILILAFGLGLNAAWSNDDISVSPLSITLSASESIQNITIKNNANYPILIQSKILPENIVTNKDLNTPTKDIILTPPLIEVPAQSTQIFRLGILKPKYTTKESKYRLVLTTIPRKHENKPGINVQFILHLGIPVWVLPIKPVYQLGLNAKAHHKSLLITVANKGNAHYRLTKLIVTELKSKKVIATQEMADNIIANKEKRYSIALNPITYPIIVHAVTTPDFPAQDVIISAPFTS